MLDAYTKIMSDLAQRLIGVIPGGDWATIARKGLKDAKGGGLPIIGMGDDWDYLRLPGLVTLQCSLHLMVAGIGGEKIFADEQEDDISLIELLVALSLIGSSCQQFAAI